MQLAAATAIKGTKRPMSPPERRGLLATILLKPRAVDTLAVQAKAYAIPNCSLDTLTEAVDVQK